MIEINLLPEELKIQARRRQVVIGIETKSLPYLLSLFVIGILILQHMLLGVVIVFKSGQLHKLNSEWKNLEGQRKALDAFNKEYAIMSEDALTIRKFAEQRINWAEKLNKLSLKLPPGIWFNDLTFAGSDLTLQGSVVSLEKEEINEIKKFTDSLKNDASFFKDFNKIELVSVKMRTIGGYDVFDFVLACALKPASTTPK